MTNASNVLATGSLFCILVVSGVVGSSVISCVVKNGRRLITDLTEAVLQ